MENLLLEAGGVMGLTYYILNLVKPAIPEQAKPYIPLISAVLAGVLNMAVKQDHLLESFFAWVLMGLSTSKGHDIQKSISKPLDPYTKENEIG